MKINAIQGAAPIRLDGRVKSYHTAAEAGTMELDLDRRIIVVRTKGGRILLVPLEAVVIELDKADFERNGFDGASLPPAPVAAATERKVPRGKPAAA